MVWLRVGVSCCRSSRTAGWLKTADSRLHNGDRLTPTDRWSQMIRAWLRARRRAAIVYDAGGCRDAGDSGWRDTGDCRDADAIHSVGDWRDTGVVDLFVDKTWLYVRDFGICVATVLPCDFPFSFVTLIKPALFPGQSSRVSINKPAMWVIFSRNLACASRISVTSLSVLSVWLLLALPSVYFRMPLYREISRRRESLSLYKRLISLFCLCNIFLKLSNSDFCSV